MKEYIFEFVATHFSGLGHEDNPRSEVIAITADDFTAAVEELRKKLRGFRGCNSFRMFTVTTPDGSWRVLTEPTLLFDTGGFLIDASFILGEQLTAAR